ncbi:hypothetical protein [Fictibacillus gelatini]|uniref:hypothetical protein n=1 Tax=Fictibacillus gelatini TaxID=225985 RepID=UPI00041D1668|nr:hypothetical protein [Fictibacillus gelatini]
MKKEIIILGMFLLSGCASQTDTNNAAALEKKDKQIEQLQSMVNDLKDTVKELKKEKDNKQLQKPKKEEVAITDKSAIEEQTTEKAKEQQNREQKTDYSDTNFINTVKTSYPDLKNAYNQLNNAIADNSNDVGNLLNDLGSKANMLQLELKNNKPTNQNLFNYAEQMYNTLHLVKLNSDLSKNDFDYKGVVLVKSNQNYNDLKVNMQSIDFLYKKIINNSPR